MKRETLERARQIVKSVEICGDMNIGCEGCMYYDESSSDCLGSWREMERQSVDVLFEIVLEENENGQENA